jgi:anti-sigma factor RsiW
MTHTRVDRLLDAFADGRLDARRQRAVEAHLGRCGRCAARLEAARRLTAALAASTPLPAPAGFARQVMDAVYAEALRPAPARAEEVRRAQAARVYRRLGFSFVVTAGILAVTLAVPRLAYPRLIDAAGAARGGDAVVKSVISGAAQSVRGALGESQGGMSR